MGFILGLLHNPLFVSAALGWLIAQVSKVVICIMKGEFTPERLGGGGGMPSSHSATVTSLACATGIVYGSQGFEFPMAVFFAFIVIYDAMGVRYQTGLHAVVVNTLYAKELENGQEPLLRKPLKEKMGHTISEIVVGIILGLIISFFVCKVMFGY